MNSLSEHDLSRALQDLADAPGPAGMADRALAGARRMRHRRTALATGAAVAFAATGVLAVPILLPAAEQDHPGINVGTPGQASPSPCVTPSVAPESGKDLAGQDWPRFVQIAIGALPPRDDYVVSSATSTCSSAYAVIRVGATGSELGHLVLHLAMRQSDDPANCAELPSRIDPEYQVLSCEDLTASAPMVFAISNGTAIIVNAYFADNRHVWMESWSTDSQPVIGADEVRAVVTNPELAQLIGP